ncbi:hypothetical protein R1sor_009098 [Riccia sorocarpa]|uniref:Uncharacterized protein n=1 Tax=Riccia sorocarpa TaxID=122646 RepID=A0ABD3HAU1_9MARC
MDIGLPVTELTVEELWALLDEAEVLRVPIKQESVVALQTGLSHELAGCGDWKNALIELERDSAVRDQKKYNIKVTALRNEIGQPVWAHRLWNYKSAPPFTPFGTLLEGPDGFYSAGLGVGVGGFHFSDIPVGTTCELLSRRTLRGDIASASGESSSLTRVAKQTEAINGLVISLMGEISQVRSAFTELQADFKRVRQHYEEQSLELRRQLRTVQDTCKEQHTELCTMRVQLEKVVQLMESQVTLADFKADLQQLQHKMDVQSSECKVVLTEQVAAIQALSSVTPVNLRNELSEMESRLRSYANVTRGGEAIPAPDLEKILGEVDSKFRNYVEEARSKQVTLAEEHDRESIARQARGKNIRIVGLEELPGEDTQAVVQSFFLTALQIQPAMETAVRVGRESGKRTILVRFLSLTTRGEVLSKRALLKGRQIWLDPDLTPLQVEDRKKEVLKVKEASTAGWVAFMRDGRAVITSKRRDDK